MVSRQSKKRYVLMLCDLRQKKQKVFDSVNSAAYYFAFFEDICSSGCRGIAQSGSASGLGPEGREFESLYPDQFIKSSLPRYLETHNAPVAHSDRASAF